MKNKSQVLGGLYLVTAAFIYSLYGVFSRKISAFSPFSQNFVRAGIVFLILTSYFLLHKRRWLKVQRKDIKWFLIWIIPSSFQMILTFIAFNNLDTGTVYFIIYSTIIIGSFLSGKLFFKEKLNKGKIVSLLLVFGGLLCIYGSDINFITNIYIFLALLSGLIVGLWNTLTKKLSGNYSEFQMLVIDSFATFAVSFGGFKITQEVLPPTTNPSPWVWIVIFALATIATTSFLIKGFRILEAQIGSLILPLEVVFASIVGYIFLGEVLSIWTYIGGILIFIAAIWPYLSKRIKFI